MRKTFKNTQRAVERNIEYATKTTKELAKSTAKVNKLTVTVAAEKYKSKSASPSTSGSEPPTASATPAEFADDVNMTGGEDTTATPKESNTEHLPKEVQESISQLDTMIARMKGLRRKIVELKDEQNTHTSKTKTRIEFLAKLASPNMKDVDSDEYKSWAKVRLEMLISDYCLRTGKLNTALVHSKDLGIEDLIDADELRECFQIEQSLRRDHSIKDCQNWCKENRQFLKKIRSSLEFEIRLQHFIELARSGDQTQAIAYFRTELSQKSDENYTKIQQASALLAFGPDLTIEPYAEFYSAKRWDQIADMFVETFQDLNGLPTKSAFLRYLATGISSLKTHSCDLYSHEGEEDEDEDLSEYPRKPKEVDDPLRTVRKQKMDLSKGFMCPVCSIELRKLAAPLPFAMHNKSHLESDPVVLPNNRIYGRKKLEEYSKRITGTNDEIVDPVTEEMFPKNLLSVVYPT